MTATPQGPVDVLVYVQHLLGIGHLSRAATLARALAEGGLGTVLASGGPPVAGLETGGARLAQLPPVRARDESFRVLLDAAGQPVDEAWKAARRARLLELYRRLAPRALLIELFPFGRRQMRFELLPLLEAAHASRPRPQILCSLRDVLTESGSAEKSAWMLEVFARYFDVALVHGDPAFLPLEASFPRAPEIVERLRYTGYVVAAPPAPEPDGTAGRGEVVVSTGGGAVARSLIAAALAARPLSALAEVPWRLLVGPNLPEAEFRELAARAPAGVVVERARPDFRALLARARLSISQAGYNTVLEVLAAGLPAVVVPFAAGTETEQSLRARTLAGRGALVVVEEPELSAQALAAAVDRALAVPRGAPGAAPLDLGGAQRTVELVRERLLL